MMSDKSQALMSRFNLKYPIFQAAPGGEALAIAVANSGAMGAVALSWDSPERAAKIITMMNESTAGNYYANFVLHFELTMLDAALEAGCPIVQFSWGIPSTEVVAKVRGAGAQLGIQVSSKESAENAMAHEPDFIICQGLEAGGHVQATSALKDTVPDVLAVAGDTPVLLSGGISTGQDIRAAIDSGASGAVLGTRFMATQESDAHDEYKNQLVAADADSTVYTICFNQDWNAAHRVLRNSTFRNWEGEGCPDTGSKPGENDQVADHPVFGPAVRYNTVPPLVGHEGALEEMAMYAGEGVGAVNDVPTAGQLIERLWAEYEDV
ncbi:MAG: NAD(P)H-dependent flavin oxidoreductase [Woeseiaceae bacterium]